MLYLNSDHISQIGFHWFDLIEVIENSIWTIHKNDYSQPIKPYLRYNDLKNRIIAMPAYIGGKDPSVGIKWIASFPGNINKNLPRASSITLLNQYDTGILDCIINSNLISGVRTAAVSGLLVEKYDSIKRNKAYKIGIVGFGPIGKLHLAMLETIIGDKISEVRIYDLKEIKIDTINTNFADKIMICKSWEDCYINSDIFLTCTVSDSRYINLPPRKGSLQLNISLRDYMFDIKKFMNRIIVDDWAEVCREDTDIENMFKYDNLRKEDTMSLIELICNNEPLIISDDDIVMFNPMGMAVFDVAIAKYYHQKAVNSIIGINLL